MMAAAVGKRLQAWTGPAGAATVALVAVAALLSADTLRLWSGRSTSLGPARQTPYEWRAKGWLGVWGWGLDTGLPFTTVRATPLPMLGLILAATGHAAAFHGLFYGAGLLLGVGRGMSLVRARRRTDKAIDELTERFMKLRPGPLLLTPSALTVAALAGTVIAHAG